MPDYSKSKIYKIVSDSSERVYIGSTTQRLCNRMTTHRKNLGKQGNCTSKELVDMGDAKIILIENYQCKSKEELLARERYWIESTPLCVNKVRQLNRTDEDRKRRCREYNKENKEILSDKNRKYYIDNQERIKSHVKHYREKNDEAIKKRKNEKLLCECGHWYTNSNHSRHLRSTRHLKGV